MERKGSFNGFGREPAEGSLIFAFISKAREGEMAPGRRSWLVVSGQKRRKLAFGENGDGGVKLWFSVGKR